jgi:hypothetical protein
MTDYEALQVIMKTTELRMSDTYRAAEALRRNSAPADMATASQNSPEYAAIRLLIGTWERIAMFVEEFTEPQRRRFFRCHPVLLVWQSLLPAVDILRQSGDVGPRFASEFEWLANQYRHWSETIDGQEYRTDAQQSVCALFF